MFFAGLEIHYNRVLLRVFWDIIHIFKAWIKQICGIWISEILCDRVLILEYNQVCMCGVTMI